MTRTRALVLALAGLLLLAFAACAGRSRAAEDVTAPTPAPSGPGLSKVLLLGDSVAAGEALPLAAAFEASGVGFHSIASDGGGNVVGPFSGKNWERLPAQINAAEPDVVIYQLTTYDWGSRQDQLTAYDRLRTTVAEAGAELVFVSGPPIRADDFYRPHLTDLARTSAVAREVTERSPENVTALDASAVWGDAYQRLRDGEVDRSTDGIHTCPQGAARFTTWLLAELAKRYPGFRPAAPEVWANTGWSADKHFVGC